MIKFEKPEYKITEYQENNHYGKFELEPLERGFGTTIGNALRRVMLSSLPGSAITSVKIDGVLHEFQKIDGVYEDVTMIILNLKNVVVKNHSEEEKIIRISASTPGEVKAGDIEHDADIEIMNPDLVICTLVEGGKIEMEMTVNNGSGYADAKENHGLRYTRYTGLAQVTNWVRLKFAAMNLKKFAIRKWEDTHNLLQILIFYPKSIQNPSFA